MLVQLTGSGIVLKSFGSDRLIDVSYTSAAVAISPTTAEEVVGDAVLIKATGASGYPVHTFDFGALPLGQYSVSNLDPDKCTFSGITLTANAAQTGVARIIVSASGGHRAAAKMITVSVAQLAATVSYSLDRYSAGTIGEAALDTIEGLLDPAKDLEYYNGTSFATCEVQPGGIARNPDCWGADFDLSGVAIQHLLGDFFGGGALITRRHYVVSHHFQPKNKVGTVLKFLGSDGTVYARTVIGQTTGSEVPGTLANPLYDIGDVAVFLLDSDLPAAVASYDIAGEWADPSVFDSAAAGVGTWETFYKSPYITTNQNRRVLFTTSCEQWATFDVADPLPTVDVRGFSYQRRANTFIRFAWGPRYTGFPGFQAAPITGDSGSPVFYPHADFTLSLICLTSLPYGGAYLHAGLINALIQEVDDQAGIATGYSVTESPEPTII